MILQLSSAFMVFVGHQQYMTERFLLDATEHGWLAGPLLL